MAQLPFLATPFAPESPGTSPHPFLALTPLLSLLLALGSSAAPLISRRLGIAPASLDKLPDDLPSTTDGEEGEEEDLAKERSSRRALYLTRAALVAASTVGSAALLSVSLGRVLAGDGSAWESVFDVGVAVVAIYLVLAPLLGILSVGLKGASEMQRIALSAALFVEVGLVNITPLTYYNQPTRADGATLGLVQVGLTGALVLILLVTPPVWTPHLPGAKPNPEQIASPLSRHTFSFLDRGMFAYFRHPDAKPFALRVPPLPDVITSTWVLAQFTWAIGTDASETGGVAAFARLHRAELFKILLYSIVWLAGVFASPLSLNLLLSYVQNNASTRFSPYLFVFGIFAGPIASSIAYQSALYRVSKLGVCVRVGLADAVFNKVFRTKEGGEGTGSESGSQGSGEKEKQSSGGDAVGKVNNLVGTDIDVITSSLERSLQLLAIPPKLIISLVGLYILLGWSAFVALGTILAFAPLSVTVSKRYGGVQEEIMQATDRRMTLIGELVSSIRIIKMMSWERTSEARILEARQTELDAIRHRARVFAGLMILSTGIPAAVTLATFGAYVFVMKNELTAAKAFTAISLFGLLREAVISSTYLLSAFMRARVSLRRITSYIAETEELDEHPRDLASTESISFQDARFKWSEYASGSNQFVLNIEHLEIPTGRLTLVAGDVGSGKTALLYSLLGEMHRMDGSITYPKDSTTSYASQSPWLQDDSIRNNILFGAEWEEDRYNKVVFQCALEGDLKIMPEGDRTLVGEKGLSISGGQKQRIALARAVYANSSIVLLDDVLSAVDSNTVSHLVEHCLNGDLLAGRTVVLVTHFVKLCARELENCDLIVYLSTGQVRKTDHPSTLHRKQSSTLTSASNSPSPSFIQWKEETQEPGSEPKGVDEDNEVEVSWATYRRYFSAAGGPLFWSGYILVNITAHVLMLAQGWWVSLWVMDPQRPGFYFTTYAGIQITAAVSLTAMYLYLIFGALRASRVLHARLTASIFAAPFRFFDTTPQGNIINRFSKDTEVVDTEIVESTQPVLDYSVQVAFVAVMVTVILPLFLIPALLVGVLFFGIGRLYIRNALAARKHVAGARSPLFSTLGDSAAGVVTIRAFGRQRDFTARFIAQTDNYNKMQLFGTALERWLEERSDFVAATTSFSIGLLSLRGNLSPGTTGFLVATGLEFTSRILFVVRAVNQQQLSINSADRIVKYSNIEQEPASTKEKDPPASWPHAGAISFDHYSAKYGPNSHDVLYNLSLDIAPGEKVGIVGPSGCGKSSLALAILRCIICSSGQITIDGRSVLDTNLEALRSRVTLIPQDPTLFSGTLRSNLDPKEEYDDAELWSALKRTQFVNDTSGYTLETQVSSGGANFSQGQRQLLSLARAMVRRSKVLILDEATASLDYDTDQVVQRVIREEFNDATNLTIAHRLDSVMDFDRILVLQAGRVCEFDTPKALLDRTDSVLRNMVEATGNFDKLYKGEDAYYPALRTSNRAAITTLGAQLDVPQLRASIAKAHPTAQLITAFPIMWNDLPMGGTNVHIPIEFDDGAEWLVRLPQSTSASPPKVLADQSLSSEVCTYRLLKSVGIKVPNIYALELNATSPSYFLMDRLPGKPTFFEVIQDEGAKTKIIDDVADCFIAISTLPLALRGAPTFVENGQPSIGPLVDPRWCSRTANGSLKTLGPFSSARAKHLACIEMVLARIRGGYEYVEAAEEVYLIHLELIEIVKILYPHAAQDMGPPFFLKHAESKGDNWLIDDSNHISGFIDWEWTEATSPQEAFVAPEAFIDVGAFYDGSNDLGPLETALADALDRKARSDLADFVRNGKAYQRLPFLIGASFDRDYYNMFAALRLLVLGEAMERERWLEKARMKFAADAGLMELQ